jgi:hypothetical protein
MMRSANHVFPRNVGAGIAAEEVKELFRDKKPVTTAEIPSSSQSNPQHRVGERPPGTQPYVAPVPPRSPLRDSAKQTWQDVKKTTGTCLKTPFTSHERN